MDYRRPAVAPMIDLCGAMAEHFQTLDGLPRSTNAYHFLPGLPSWAANFCDYGDFVNDHPYTLKPAVMRPGESRGAAQGLGSMGRIQRVESCLKVYGIELDRIEGFTPILERHDYRKDGPLRPGGEGVASSLHHDSFTEEPIGSDLSSTLVQIMLLFEDYPQDPVRPMPSRSLIHAATGEFKDAAWLLGWFDACGDLLVPGRSM